MTTTESSVLSYKRLEQQRDELLVCCKELRQVIVAFNQSQTSATQHIGGWSLHAADVAIAAAEKDQ